MYGLSSTIGRPVDSDQDLDTLLGPGRVPGLPFHSVPDMTRAKGSPDSIGKPLLFSTGQWAGRTVRAELQELQQPDIGRKYSKVDRRPVDPPPVVLLKLFEVLYQGTSQAVEVEMNYEDVQTIGLIAHVDLFSCLPDTPTPLDPFSSSQSDQPDSPFQPRYPPVFTPYTYTPGVSSAPYAQDVVNGPGSGSLAETSQTRYVDYGDDVIHQVENYSITEASRMTGDLVGEAFVQASNVDYQGHKSLLFAFGDIAVRLEGMFLLRYRVFDIFSQTDSGTVAIQAETYGGVFKVHSTKDFPGLRASTDLTKHLKLFGVAVNVREAERKRGKHKAEDGSNPSPKSAGGRRPLSDED